MIPSGRAFALWGTASLLFVFAFAAPQVGALGLVLDALIGALVLLDARRARRVRLAVERALAPVVHQGEPVRCELALENPARRAVRVRLRELLTPLLADAPVTLDVAVPARTRLQRGYELVPRWRGADTLAPAALRVLGPWRLAWASREAAAGQRVKVYPRLRLEGEVALLVKRASERRLGAHPLFARGISSEIYALREYLPGDEYRRIHWKATARRHRPVVREQTWEQHQSLIVMVDCGRPMAALAGVHSKLDHALAAVIALLRVVVAQQDDALLVLFSKEVRRVVRVDRRTRSFAPVFEAVYGEAADLDEPDYAAVTAYCARRVPRRSLALVCTSVVDLIGAETLGRALTGLAARHLPLLVNLEDPGLVAHAESVPDEPLGAFAKGSALSIVAGNRALGARLRAQGVELVTTPADRLAFSMVRRYLDLKARRRF